MKGDGDWRGASQSRVYDCCPEPPNGGSGAPASHSSSRASLECHNAHGAVFEIGGEPGRIARGRDTRLAGADDGDGLVGGKMRKRFFEGTGKSGGGTVYTLPGSRVTTLARLCGLGKPASN